MVDKNSGDARRAAFIVAVCPCLEHHDLVSQKTETRHCIHDRHLTLASLDQEENIDCQAGRENEKEYKPEGDGVLVGSTRNRNGCSHCCRDL